MQFQLIFVLAFSLLGMCAGANIVTRYVTNAGGVPVTDKFPNPESTCAGSGCVQANGYKECLSCCYCRCNDGSYWSAGKTCLDDYTIANDCQMVLGTNSYKGYVVATSSGRLDEGETVSYCSNSWDQCTTKANNCVINRERTFYESNGWKIMWPNSAVVDFEIKRRPGQSSTVRWSKTDCAQTKYDGLLVSLGLTCLVNGKSTRSCLAFKVSGSYQIGSNPVLRTNCTGPTTAATTRASTLQRTSSAATTTAMSTTGEKLTTKHTTTRSPSTRVTSSSDRSTRFTEKTKMNVSASPAVSNKSFSPEYVFTERSLTSTASETGLEGKRKSDKSSKNSVIVAASLSSAALLLIVFLAVAAHIFIKRRRHSAARHKKFSAQSEIIISDPLPLATTTAVLEGISTADGNNRFWTINGEGEFTIARRPPLYSIRAKEDSPSPGDEALYDEPAADRKNSCSKLYAVVNKRREGKCSELDDVIERGSSPLPQTHVSGHVDDHRDPIYDEPDIVINTPVVSEQNNINEPVYMLYEPFPGNRDTS